MTNSIKSLLDLCDDILIKFFKEIPINFRLINKQFKLDDISDLVETIIDKKYSSITNK